MKNGMGFRLSEVLGLKWLFWGSDLIVAHSSPESANGPLRSFMFRAAPASSLDAVPARSGTSIGVINLRDMNAGPVRDHFLRSGAHAWIGAAFSDSDARFTPDALDYYDASIFVENICCPNPTEAQKSIRMRAAKRFGSRKISTLRLKRFKGWESPSNFGYETGVTQTMKVSGNHAAFIARTQCAMAGRILRAQRTECLFHGKRLRLKAFVRATFQRDEEKGIRGRGSQSQIRAVVFGEYGGSSNSSDERSPH